MKNLKVGDRVVSKKFEGVKRISECLGQVDGVNLFSLDGTCLAYLSKDLEVMNNENK